MANFYRKSHQSGRSMIEMLGVLAIIGVLSLGSISAYSQAMFKHRLNKMVDQYTELFTTINLLKDEFMKNFPHGQTLYPIISEMGKLPDGMKFTGNTFAYDVFNHSSEVRRLTSGILVYISLSEQKNGQHATSEEARKICGYIYQYLFIPNRANISEIFFYHNDAQGEGSEGLIYGDKGCKNGAKCLKNLTIGDIAAICNSYGADRESRLVVIF